MTKTTKNQSEKLVIDLKAIDRKIRRQPAPPARIHRNKKAYTRKAKHPKNLEN